MPTQREAALAGRVTPQMSMAAASEGAPVERVLAGLADGSACLPANPAHRGLSPRVIGAGFRVKVNANIGTSMACSDHEAEMRKLAVALDAGADAVMDLSTGGDLAALRRGIVEASPVPVGTVPIYQAAVAAFARTGDATRFTADDLFAAIADHARDGVDFVTVHCGVTREAVRKVREEGRVTRIVSRGGSLLAAWMDREQRENPLFTDFDRLLDICREHEVTLSLGDGLRPGSLADATDSAQLDELVTLGHLTKRAWEAGVQVMVEGPGHVPLHQIAANVVLMKRLCHGAPFYVLGPLVTDCAAGYDHLAGAIGGAIAALAGADFLCYVTPAEHLTLPDEDDVRRGVVASKIAAHAVDLARGDKQAWERDRAMSVARAALDWETQKRLALDPVEVAERLARRTPSTSLGAGEACSMCGQLCAYKIFP